MRKSNLDKVWEKHISWSFTYGCGKGEIRWKKIGKNIVLCQRCHRESKVTACSRLQLD
jgi:hypothetical protein